MTSKGSRAKIPPAPAPTPTPAGIEKQSLDAGEAERKRRSAGKGRRGTILTESTGPQKQSLLGDTV